MKKRERVRNGEIVRKVKGERERDRETERETERVWDRERGRDKEIERMIINDIQFKWKSAREWGYPSYQEK